MATISPATNAARREERTFQRGKQAAARLVRALATPDRTAQLAAAKVLIDADKAITLAIETAKTAEAERDRWPEASPEQSTTAANLALWHREGVHDTHHPNHYSSTIDAG